MIGFHIKSDRVILSLVDCDAVAVKAINLHSGGTKPRRSLSRLYSVLNDSPLIYKYTFD